MLIFSVFHLSFVKFLFAFLFDFKTRFHIDVVHRFCLVEYVSMAKAVCSATVSFIDPFVAVSCVLTSCGIGSFSDGLLVIGLRPYCRSF